MEVEDETSRRDTDGEQGRRHLGADKGFSVEFLA